jgi:hypothetical protein
MISSAGLILEPSEASDYSRDNAVKGRVRPDMPQEGNGD